MFVGGLALPTERFSGKFHGLAKLSVSIRIGHVSGHGTSQFPTRSWFPAAQKVTRLVCLIFSVSSLP